MAVKIKHKNGRYYGYVTKESTGYRELMERIARALYDPEGILDGDGSTIPEESWEEIKLETSVRRNKAAKARAEVRSRKRKEARRKSGIRRLLLRCIASLSVIVLAAVGLQVSMTLEWWHGVPLLLAALLLQCWMI